MTRLQYKLINIVSGRFSEISHRELFVALYFLDSVLVHVKDFGTWEDNLLIGIICLYFANLMYASKTSGISYPFGDYYYMVKKIFTRDQFIEKMKEILFMLKYDLIISTIYDFGIVKEYFDDKQWKINKCFMLILSTCELRFKYLQEELYEISAHFTRRYHDKNYNIPDEYKKDIPIVLNGTRILDDTSFLEYAVGITFEEFIDKLDIENVNVKSLRRLWYL